MKRERIYKEKPKNSQQEEKVKREEEEKAQKEDDTKAKSTRESAESIMEDSKKMEAEIDEALQEYQQNKDAA